MKFIFTISFTLFIQALALSQNPVYKSIDKTIGLPSNTIYDLFQDAQGFIWIGHDKGLSKYDGFRFTHYQNNQQRGRPLSNLMQDSLGRIWCQNFIGQFFYVDNHTLQLCKELEPIGFYSPAGMVKGKMLITAGNDSLRYLEISTMHLKQKKLDLYSNNHYTYSNKHFYHFFNKHDGKLFISDELGIIKVEDAPRQLDHFFVIPTLSASYYVPKYPSFRENLINWQNGKSPFQFPANTFIQNVRILRDSSIAINTSKGLYLFDDQFNPVLNGNHYFFTSKNTSCTLRDREGNWWIGTLNEGVLFVPNMATNRKFEDLSLTAIKENKRTQELYLGTADNQVLSYSLKKNTLTPLYKHDLIQEISSIFYDSTTEDLGYASNKLFIYPKIHLRLNHDGAIKDILKLDNSNYIAAASGFIGIYSKYKKAVRGPWTKAYQSKGIHVGLDSSQFRLNNTEIRVRSLGLLKDSIFAATTNGLLLYTLQGSHEIKYQEKSLIASDLETYQSTLYVASFNEGLLKYQKGQLVKLYSPEKYSLAGIYKIKISKGVVWMLTESSIIAYHLQNGNITSIDHSNGLPMDDLRDLCILNDTLYLVGNKGLVCFPTISKQENKIEPSLIINSFKVNQQEKNLDLPIKLTNTENDIVIDYSIISYSGGANLKAEYSINGSDWRPLESNTRELSLASLSPNTYTIELRASANQTDATKPAQVSFIIRKPFYEQPWFILLLAFIILGGAYLFYKQRLAKIRYQNKLETDRLRLEQELQQSLLSSIKAQMNPHFIYNALSSIHSFVYSDDKEKAIKYLDNLSELTRKVLELSNRENILLSEEIDLLTTYISIEKMRFGESFTSSITCSPEIDIHFVRLPSMIIQPFVENAIKHGLLHKKGNKELVINFNKHINDLVITIEDNGVGRKRSHELKSNKNKKHDSFSISANKKRLELLNAKKKNAIGLNIIDKTDEMGQGIGTKVIITIPSQFS